jgi:hypothetical protein
LRSARQVEKPESIDGDVEIFVFGNLNY